MNSYFKMSLACAALGAAGVASGLSCYKTAYLGSACIDSDLHIKGACDTPVTVRDEPIRQAYSDSTLQGRKFLAHEQPSCLITWHIPNADGECTESRCYEAWFEASYASGRSCKLQPGGSGG